MTDDRINPDDWAMFKSIGDPAVLMELLDAYLEDAPHLLEQMRVGLVAGDAEIVRRAAHSLKANSASFGAQRLAGLSRELEMATRSGSLEGTEAKLQAIQAEYMQLLPVLAELKHECE